VNPRLGSPLGHNTYKIRLKITSTGKGESGGARVISLVENTVIGITEIASGEEIIINLISIYDKGEVDSISDKELREIIKKSKEG
jgi:hypothetical protein